MRDAAKYLTQHGWSAQIPDSAIVKIKADVMSEKHDVQQASTPRIPTCMQGIPPKVRGVRSRGTRNTDAEILITFRRNIDQVPRAHLPNVYTVSDECTCSSCNLIAT